MERVAFLLPRSGTWVRCLLNPACLVVHRESGVRQAGAHGRPLTTAGGSDDPVLLTGGGRTRLTLDLLFDVELAVRPVPDQDVRHLSDPLWNLADHHTAIVRLVWGKHWNLPGVITAAAQRFDRFLADGTPRRNWMRLRFQRVGDDQAGRSGSTTSVRGASTSPAERRGPAAGGRLHHGRADPYVAGSRLDLLAAEHLGDPGRWREIAAANAVDDPLRLGRSRVLRLPGGAT